MKPYNFPQPGITTPNGTGTSTSVGSTVIAIPGRFVGKDSEGLVARGEGRFISIGFGTNSSDPIPNQSFAASLEDQRSGSIPELVETDSAGNQFLAYGRVFYRASTKELYAYHKFDDALVADSPRCQLYMPRLVQKSFYYRFYLKFSFGCPGYPWADNLDRVDILFFQLKNDSNPPVLTLSTKIATNGDPNYRNINLLWRADPLATPIAVGVIENIDLREPQGIILDYFPDWLTSVTGGKAYLALWHNGVQIELLGGSTSKTDISTIYAAPDGSGGGLIIRPMVGIYRYQYNSVQAPNSCGITFHTVAVDCSSDKPEYPIGGMEIFDQI